MVVLSASSSSSRLGSLSSAASEPHPPPSPPQAASSPRTALSLSGHRTQSFCLQDARLPSPYRLPAAKSSPRELKRDQLGWREPLVDRAVGELVLSTALAEASPSVQRASD